MTEKNEQENEEQSTSAIGQRPAFAISGSGGIQVAVWKNKGDHGDFYFAKLERRYLGSGEQWQSTESLRADDLLRAQKLLGEADDWIERDKQKQRGLREVG